MLMLSQPSRLLLRSQTTNLSRTFSRCKSLTAAIERGRQDGPDRPARAARYEAPSNLRRREERLARFGPARDDDSGVSRARQERPRLDSSGSFPPRRENRDPFSTREFEGRRSQNSAKPRSERRPVRSDRFDRRDRNDRGRDHNDRGRDRGGTRRDIDRGRDSNDTRRDYEGARYERRPVRSNDFEGRSSRFERQDRWDNTDTRFQGRSFRDRDTLNHRREPSDRNPGKPLIPREGSRTYTRDGPTTRFADRSAPPDSTSDQSPRSVKERDGATKNGIRDVESLPYTTAASEFIYGYSSVLAALKANRRKLYNLYVHARGASRDGLMSRIREQKLFPITKEVGDEYLRAMDKASTGRPHNGVILETSPLPLPPITELQSSTLDSSVFAVTLDGQSAEDAVINGKQEVYEYKSSGWRHPLILYVDGVLDEGNLGAIARSAYFLNVDAVITPSRQTAPWSHIAVKASAGAAEALPLFTVREPADFLGKCSRNGWRIYASDSVPATSSITDSSSTSTADDKSKVVYSIARSSKRLAADHSPVAKHPTILMMGAEGAGLRQGLLNLAHYNVGIVHGRDVDEIGVDSLNVSVAASLLCFHMLQKPFEKSVIPAEEQLF